MPRRTDHEAGTIEAAICVWAAEQERTVTEHLDPEELVAYQEGRLDPVGAERLRCHLVACAACREELLLLGDFDREVPEGSPLLPSPEATERSWQRFEAAWAVGWVATGDAGGVSSARRLPQASPLAARRWLLAASLPLALAAGLVLGALLLGRGAPDRMAVAGSPYVFDLDPAGTEVLRDAGGLREVGVPPGMDPLVPRLNLGDLTPHETYMVEVFAAGGQLLLRRKGLRRDRTGSITFLVPKAEWPPGEYRVRLIALDAGQRQELAAYAFRLRYEP